MLSAIAAAAIIVAASLVVGQALLALAGRREWSPLAAGVGFAALLVVCALAAKLPGRSGTAAAVAGVVVIGAVVVLVRGGLAGRGLGGDSGDSPLRWLAVGLAAAVAASIPFLVNDRVGVLGAGLVNDDMANHLLMADWVQNETEPRPELIDDGYPLGPHSLAAALADLLGTGLVEAFAGLTLAIAALAALTALAALRNLPSGRRAVAAVLAALPYLGVAYLVQGAFKEPIQALLLITFVLLLATPAGRWGASSRQEREDAPQRRWGAGLRAVPIGVVVAAALFNYSFPGLFWLAGAAAVWWLLTAGPSPRALAASARAALPGIAAVIGMAIVLTLPDWTRIADFAGFGAFDPAGEQTGLGNLRQALNPLEALGIWPTGEYRADPADASLPAGAYYLAGAFAALALALGLLRVLRRGRAEPAGQALVSALAAAVVVYAGAAVEGTPYTSAKALAIASPVAMLLALRGLLAPDSVGSSLGAGRRTRPGRLAAPVATALAVAFVAAAAVSSFLVLRQAPVAPGDHAEELAEIRRTVEGEPVLFLGRDDFIAWHLRGSPVSTHIQNFFSTGRVPARIDPRDGEKFDFDAVSAETLDRFDWVLTTSSGHASFPPENFRPANSTPSYVLWERDGATEDHRILDEGATPGAPLDCASERLDAKEAIVWRTEPVAGEPSRWRPSATAPPGTTATQRLRLGRGTWELSLAYDSPRPVALSVTGAGPVADRASELPANLDFRGPTPPFPFTVVEMERPGELTVEATPSEAPLAGRLLGGEGEAHLRELFAAPLGRGEGRARCGDYVDWYR